ncbi:Knottin [Macleaya cordata]|uniref:Knottin n=1 Tax=Macleaya cordata TaxID=56857 RepID=A0A200PYC5_MACCD|nr:Knottin [Macleaya cordata]
MHAEDEMVMVAEAGKQKGPRLCESPSHRFKWLCNSDRNCASVCKSEGFLDGHCRGFRHRCFCRQPCSN